MFFEKSMKVGVLLLAAATIFGSRVEAQATPQPSEYDRVQDVRATNLGDRFDLMIGLLDDLQYRVQEFIYQVTEQLQDINHRLGVVQDSARHAENRTYRNRLFFSLDVPSGTGPATTTQLLHFQVSRNVACQLIGQEVVGNSVSCLLGYGSRFEEGPDTVRERVGLIAKRAATTTLSSGMCHFECNETVVAGPQERAFDVIVDPVKRTGQ